MSNLSDIGFPTPSEQAVNDMIMQVLDLAKPVECSRGFYLKYSDPSGAEIYLQGNFQQELVGFNPHFAGPSRRKVNLARAVERESSELDGGFYAWANPAFDKGEYPFVFDVPDFRTLDFRDFPRRAEIQLTAFASNDFKLYANEAEYQAAQESELKYATKMFIASGLFAFDEADAAADLNTVRPVGHFAGEVTDFQLKTNDLSKEKFYWLQVETLGGPVDVVVDPKYVTAEPAAGAIVSGQFWLSGKIL